MEDAVVLFMHHRNDAVTQCHEQLLRTHNPFPIVPLFCDDGQGGQPLPNAVRVPMTYRRGRNWHNFDWICCEWFRSVQRINARRYIWLEWDCHVNMPLREWYGESWEADFVAARAVRPADDWHWFRVQRDFLPHTLHRFACGLFPINGVLLSHRSMASYAAEDLPEGIFCELRLATVLASRGISLTQMAPERSSTNRFLPAGRSLPVIGRGLFHPVKLLNGSPVQRTSDG